MLSRLVLLLFLGVAFRHVMCDDIKEEDGVLVLTKENFDSAISSNEYILVEFYAPWCGHCKALAPEYAKAAAILAEKHPNIKLAKIDATEQTTLAEQHSIRGYPTIKWFLNGRAIEYTGGRTADEIVNWVVKKSGPAVKTLTTEDELKAFKDETEVAVVGYFKSGADCDAAKNYASVAAIVDDFPYAMITDPSIATEDKIVLYKKFDEGEATFTGENNEADLKKFLTTESLPLIVEFNQETASKVFSGDVKSHLLFFMSKKAGHFEKYTEILSPVAKQFKSQMLFVSLDADIPDHARIVEYFGIKEEEIPALRIIKFEQDMVKYKPDNTELTEDNIRQFVQDYIDGKLKEHLLSEDLPEDWNKGPVTTLVASNFDEVVFDKEKDVLVEFYAPWCGHCEKLAPLYEKLGEAFKDNDNVIIAKMDATANELEHTKIGNFPTIKLYSKGDNKVIDYMGERTLEGMKKFIETGGEYGQATSGEAYEDVDEEKRQKDEL